MEAQFLLFIICPNHFSFYLYFLACKMKVILFAVLGQMGDSVMTLEPRVFFTINYPCFSIAVLGKKSKLLV